MAFIIDATVAGIQVSDWKGGPLRSEIEAIKTALSILLRLAQGPSELRSSQPSEVTVRDTLGRVSFSGLLLTAGPRGECRPFEPKLIEPSYRSRDRQQS